MATRRQIQDVIAGDGYAVGSLDALGEGYGFRKIRQALGVTAFGVNAIVMPPGYETGRHYHDEQEELYFVHSGHRRVRVRRRHQPRARARAASPGWTRRPCARSRTSADGDAVYVIVGGKDGYVGRDGRMPEGEERSPGASGAARAEKETP